MWKIVSLASVIEIVMGQAPSGKDCNKNGVGTPFVKVGEFRAEEPIIREWTTDPKKLGRNGDIFLCVVGATCGKINFGVDCAIGRSVAALRPKDRVIEQRYLYYFMSQQVQRLRDGSLGAAQTVISKDMINAIQLPLPPLAEQQRIVAKLDAAFAEIDRAVDVAINRKSELEALKRGALDNYIQSLKNEKKMGDVFEFVRGPFGGSLKKSVFVAEGFAVYEQQHAIKDQCREFRYYVPKEKFDEMSRFSVSPNAILMSCSGTIGKTTIIPTSFVEGIINQALLMLRPSEKVLPKFATLYMESKRFLQQLMERVEGAAQKNVASVKVLKEILIPVPRIEEQQQLVSDIETIFSEIDVAYSITESTKDNYVQLKSALLAQELQPPQSEAA